mgnify:CR=1 FL=1
MKIFCVENDKQNLLLVTDDLYVVNGYYYLIKHKDGTENYVKEKIKEAIQWII